MTLLAVALGALAACGDPGSSGFDRRSMLRDLTANVIVPVYRDLAARSLELGTATEALCAAPSLQHLEAARAAWRSARAPLDESWLFYFGPARDERIQSDLDFWPSRPDTIEASAASAEPVTDAWIESLGASARGFPALEYLLWDPARDDAALVGFFSEPGAGTRRCEYAEAIARNLASRSAILRDRWEPAAGNYAATLTEPASAEYPMLHDAVSALYNAVFAAAEAIKVLKIGTPQGRESLGVPQPESVESRFAGTAIDHMLTAMRAIRAVFTGERGEREGLGLLDAIRAVRADSVEPVLVTIDAAIAALETLPRPFDQHLADPVVETVYQRVRDVVRVMSTDVAALLGVTVTFTDNDGD